MKPTERILKLIEEGDPVPILAEAGVVDCFNELLRHKLIDILDEKVVLTKKGEQAKTIGLEKFLYELKTKEELQDFSPEIQGREHSKFRWCLTVCLAVLAFLIIFSLTDCTL